MGVIQMIGQHAQQPSGFLGRLLARVMTRATLPQSGWTAQMLQVRPVDHLVDVGFGNGASIEHFATLASDGRVVGVDVSDTMIAVAARRNAGAIADGPGDPTSRRPSPSKRPSLSQRRGDCCVHPVVWGIISNRNQNPCFPPPSMLSLVCKSDQGRRWPSQHRASTLGRGFHSSR